MDAERLRKLRQDRILTQQELADAAKISLRTVVALERGESTAQPRTIRKLADALGVEARELVGEPS